VQRATPVSLIHTPIPDRSLWWPHQSWLEKYQTVVSAAPPGFVGHSARGLVVKSQAWSDSLSPAICRNDVYLASTSWVGPNVAPHRENNIRKSQKGCGISMSIIARLVHPTSGAAAVACKDIVVLFLSYSFGKRASLVLLSTAANHCHYYKGLHRHRKSKKQKSCRLSHRQI
jgi:hypothetical protein